MNRRRLIFFVILIVPIFWLVMMGLLFSREAFVPRLDSDSSPNPAQPAAPRNLWLAVLTPDDTQVGYVNVRNEPESRDGAEGVRMYLLARVRLSLFGAPSELLLSGNAWMDAAAGLSEFAFDFQSAEQTMRIHAALKGDVLEGSVETGGDSFPLRLPVSNAMVLASSTGIGSFTLPDVEVGQEYLVDTFDPLTLTTSQARVACIGEESLTINGESIQTKVITTTLSGVATRAWITNAGEVLRAETPIGLTLQAVNENDALRGLSDAPGDESMRLLAAVKPIGKLPIRDATRMIVRFSGLDEKTLIPVDATQVLTGDGEYTITAPPPPTGESPLSAHEFVEADLAGDAFVQTAHERIVQTSREIVGDAATPWDKAMRIHAWVYDRLEKQSVLSLPSALEVLDEMKGDCNEHTILFTALARAAGVPTRIAIGVVWSEEYGAFYYHAWPEVYVGNWIWTDPTLGQVVADATHIKLLNGGIENWWRLVPFLGKLEINVLEVDSPETAAEPAPSV